MEIIIIHDQFYNKNKEFRRYVSSCIDTLKIA